MINQHLQRATNSRGPPDCVEDVPREDADVDGGHPLGGAEAGEVDEGDEVGRQAGHCLELADRVA